MSNITLRYKGLNCFGETDEFSGSDEIYLVTVVMTIANGEAVPRTEKHPAGINVYEDVDSGASFDGPLAPCYFGPPRDLSLIVTLMEHDEGDPNAFRDEIHGVAAGVAVAAGVPTGGVAAIAVPLLAELANVLIDSGDDVIAQVSRTFTMSQVLEEARKPHETSRDVDFTFLTDHRGSGATYQTYFDIQEAIKTQLAWRACAKCQGMYFNGIENFRGVCPAGGGHSRGTSFAYVMEFDGSPSDHFQDGWRACAKCQGMHFAKFPNFKGVCPAGGQHVQTNSFAYVMMHDVDPMSQVQRDWRACKKCQGLFFGQFKGRCPAGGEHDGEGSFNYALRFK